MSGCSVEREERGKWRRKEVWRRRKEEEGEGGGRGGRREELARVE